MYKATEKALPNATHYRISAGEAILTYSEVLTFWKKDDDFRQFFIDLLGGSSYAAYRWETPSLADSTIDRDFEFVLIDTPSFATRRTDTLSFQDHFVDHDEEQGIVTFANLGRNATMVVPSPRGDADCYGHLAAFIRAAPKAQVHALWCTVATTVESEISSHPLWLSTAGGGVAWLHVRLDSRPKYYVHAPYKNP